MLKSNFGKVEIKGIEPLIMAELVVLIQTLRSTKSLTDEQLEKAINDGFKSQTEMDKEYEQLMSKERTTEEVQRIITNITAARKSGLTKDEDNKDDEGIKVHYINADDLDDETKESLEDFLKKIMGE